MSKSIYDEVLEDVSILVKQANDGKLPYDMVVNRWGLKRIRKAIKQAQKQEKLLEELKDIFNKHSLRLDKMREWYNLQTLESRVLTDIENLIKEIENE